MTDSIDPNADLVGFTFPIGGAQCRVVGSASWNSAYVEVECADGSLTVRVASQIRQAKVLGLNLPEGAVVSKLPVLDALEPE